MTKLVFYGIVQGVGFRPTVYRIAKELGLRGFVRNNGSNVEVHIDGDPAVFLERLKSGLPPLARIDRVDQEEIAETLPPFHIEPSSEGARVSLIPTDTAICEACLQDFCEPRDRRFRYPFTNCTDCGARFTVIADLPYDRVRTSMADFPLCPACQAEYEGPNDRRFHAQTISCSACGPKYTLYDGDQAAIPGEPFAEFARRLDGGEVGLLKGWGGMHILSTFEAASRLRKLWRRGDKPYAAMMRNLECAREVCEPSEEATELLLSPQRPITLLPKRPQARELLEGVSPGLGNLGVMLPSSGAHFLLFQHLRADGIIMTSANPPGEPMITDNAAVFSLGLDCYLLHNRRIVNRCDDTVVRLHGTKRCFLRKSRGFVPVPLAVPHRSAVMGVGPETDLTGSLSRSGEVYLTQYIGDTTHYPTARYLDHALRYLASLLGTKEVEAIGLDRHPKYVSRVIARQLAEEFGCPAFEVQHHHAHLASLMVDAGHWDSLLGWMVDGTGYGEDGQAWGGELLLGDLRSCGRLAQLEYIPLLGGDRAVEDPRRLVFALQALTGHEPTHFSGEQGELFRRMLGRSVGASGLGRVLDALSCWLGVCCQRTYEGEAAIKLERFLIEGRPNVPFTVETARQDGRRVVRSIALFDQLFERRIPSTDRERADVATSFVSALVSEMMAQAAELAQEEGLKILGVSGGVSYSAPIMGMLEEACRGHSLELLRHDRVPNGDGGIAVGQNAVAGALLGR